MKHRSYINNSVANTLVEHNGELRPGNMADMDSVSWKAIRNDHEHTFAGAKQGWLERMNRNATKSWGKAPPRIPRLQQPVPLSTIDQPTGDVVGVSIDNLKAIDGNSPASVIETPPQSSENTPADQNISEVSTTATGATDVSEKSDSKDDEAETAVTADDKSDNSGKTHS